MPGPRPARLELQPNAAGHHAMIPAIQPGDVVPADDAAAVQRAERHRGRAARDRRGKAAAAEAVDEMAARAERHVTRGNLGTRPLQTQYEIRQVEAGCLVPFFSEAQRLRTIAGADEIRLRLHRPVAAYMVGLKARRA